MIALHDHRWHVVDRHRMGYRDVVDQNLVVKTDVNLCLRKNDRLDDHWMDDDHRDALGGRCKNAKDVRNDLTLVVKMDVSRDLHKSGRQGDRHTNVTDDRNDLMTDVSRVNHNCALRDPTMGAKTDVNPDLRMNDQLDDHLMADDRHDDLGGRCMNAKDDRNDLNLDEKMDGKSHHGMWMGDLNMNCDRMSHDHLQCVHLR